MYGCMDEQRRGEYENMLETLTVPTGVREARTGEPGTDGATQAIEKGVAAIVADLERTARILANANAYMCA